ncbi:MAG: type II toxin-antitoxin system Phd/YefM family antitoxin [bacterium]|nr:MAG: type II toxin-antitoxin system Phd/YefM family antitoxin [bacterium]
MTKTLPITQAREELTSLVDKAKRKLDEFVITVNGSPAAVLMSASEFDSWKETLEIMSDPQLMKTIEEGEREINEDKGKDWDMVKKQLGL